MKIYLNHTDNVKHYALTRAKTGPDIPRLAASILDDEGARPRRLFHQWNMENHLLCHHIWRTWTVVHLPEQAYVVYYHVNVDLQKS